MKKYANDDLDKYLSDDQRKAIATIEELLERHFTSHVFGVCYPRPDNPKMTRAHLGFHGRGRHIAKLVKILNDALKTASTLKDRSDN